MTWELYDRLIEGVPSDAVVLDYCLGLHWSYLEATCGIGGAFTVTGGAPRKHKANLYGRSLQEIASFAKSWNWEEATLGVAALNAWYSQADRVNAIGEATGNETWQVNGNASQEDAFTALSSTIESFHSERSEDGRANVVVVGHFPHVNEIAEYANLTVLERNCRNDCDTPDPACEYVLPQADFAFITGVTLINKTAPRILELAKDATTIMVGPSVVLSPILFEYGADLLAGCVLDDPKRARFSVKNGYGRLFGEDVLLTKCSH